MTDPSTHLFWITSRAAGITALVLSGASIGVGLTMGGKLIKGRGPDQRSIHETLSLAAIVAIAVHGLSLLGDQFLHPTVLDVILPFVYSYQTVATSLGIVAGWAIILLGLSYYLRKRIGINRWKAIHRLTILAWLAGLLHALIEGTDAGQLWFLALVGITAAPPLAALAVRARNHRQPVTGGHLLR